MPTRRKLEYITFNTAGWRDPLERLNRLGAEGWEVLASINDNVLVLGRVAIPKPKKKSTWHPKNWLRKGW